MALNILQNGSVPWFVPEEFREQIFFRCSSRVLHCRALKGIHESKSLWNWRKSSISSLYALKWCKSTLQKTASFSSQTIILRGRNKCTQVWKWCLCRIHKVLHESAGVRWGSITLGSILQFATGLDEEPPLGFELQLCIQFIAAPQNNKWIR